MSIGFQVYVDESGDEGFKFDEPNAGSSRWFVLSAVVTRKETDLQTVRLVDQVRDILKKKSRETLHFRKLKHEHRLPYVHLIAKNPLRLVSVLVHKPTIKEPEKFQSERHLLYRYATRYLLERVSWLCRDNRRDAAHVARVIFSNRSSMSYDEMRDYLLRLKDKTNEFGVRIDWSVIDPAAIESRTHDSMMGLQIADAAASSFYMACETNPRTGFTEPRYCQMLRPVVYRHGQKHLGYGLKLWPREADDCNEPHMKWLAEYGRK